MKSFIFTIILMLFFTSTSFATEKDILKAFEKIKAATEVGVNYLDYNDLLTNVKVEINLFEREEGHNKVFSEKANKCYTKYDLASFMWQLNNKSKSWGVSDTSESEIPNAWLNGSKCIDELYQIK